MELTTFELNLLHTLEGLYTADLKYSDRGEPYGWRDQWYFMPCMPTMQALIEEGLAQEVYLDKQRGFTITEAGRLEYPAHHRQWEENQRLYNI